jgi:hypothetical protein
MRRVRDTKRPMTIPSPTNNTRLLRSHTSAQVAQPCEVIKPQTKTRRRRADPWAPKRKPNPNPKPRAPPRTHFTCRICVEEQTPENFPTWIPSGRGKWKKQWDVPFECIAHLGRNPNRRKVDPICKTCIGRSMSARLDVRGARQVGVGCMEPACRNEWNWDYVMKYMPLDALEKYNMEMFDVWKRDTSIKPVSCISPRCNAMGLPDPFAPGYPEVVCNECALRFCVQCLVPWHKDVTCAERGAKQVDEQMSESEKETLKLMQTKDAKRCPNCFLVIEKEGGCNSMTCLGCNKRFNWATAGKDLLWYYMLLTDTREQHPRCSEPRKQNLSFTATRTNIVPRGWWHVRWMHCKRALLDWLFLLPRNTSTPTAVATENSHNSLVVSSGEQVMYGYQKRSGVITNSKARLQFSACEAICQAMGLGSIVTSLMRKATWYISMLP